jgi:hypothetical protein
LINNNNLRSGAAQGLSPAAGQWRQGPTKETLRNCHAQRYFNDYYGPVFPDDDAGRDDLLIALRLRAPRGEGEPTLRRYIKSAAPRMAEPETARLLDRAYASPFTGNADALGRLIGLTDSDRTRLAITSIGAIDVPRAARLARREEKKKARRKAARRASGMRPREEYETTSASRTRPWEAFGISRSTWERRGKPVPPSADESVTPSNLSTYVLGTRLTSGSKQAGKDTAASAEDGAKSLARARRGLPQCDPHETLDVLRTKQGRSPFFTDRSAYLTASRIASDDVTRLGCPQT